MSSDQPRVPDSERAITTAARAVCDRAADLWWERFGNMAGFLFLPDNWAINQALAERDALVVREEHDRLRGKIQEAIDNGPTVEDVWHNGYRNGLEAAQALLGESTQEQASE